MKIFLSGMDINSFNMYNKLFSNEPVNILLSYGLRDSNYNPLFEKQKKGKVNLILDSGTFTANGSKKDCSQKINYAGYANFVKNLNEYFDFVLAYDINFQEDAWKENIKYLEDNKTMGLQNIVPVVHSYTYAEIEKYLEMGYKLIALGYSKKYKNKDNIAQCANFIHENNAKVHLLASTGEDILKNNPIDFSDASTWVQNGKNNTVIYKDPDNGQRKYFNLNKSSTKDEDVEKLNRYLKQTIGEYITFEDLNLQNKIFRNVLNMHYFINLEKEISSYH